MEQIEDVFLHSASYSCLKTLSTFGSGPAGQGLRDHPPLLLVRSRLDALSLKFDSHPAELVAVGLSDFRSLVHSNNSGR